MKDGIMITMMILCVMYTIGFFIFIANHPNAFKCSDKVICNDQ